MNTEFSSNVSEFFELLKSVKPFSLLPTSNLELWLEKASLRNYGPGQRILRPDEVNSHVYFVVEVDVAETAAGGGETHLVDGGVEGELVLEEVIF